MNVKRLALLSLIILFSTTVSTAQANNPQQKEAPEKSVYRASNMTYSMKMIMGRYNHETGKHIMSPALDLDEFLKKWVEFSTKIDELPALGHNAEISSFEEDDFIIIKEYDNEGLETRETVFTPGLIQLKIYEIEFEERLDKPKDFFLDLLEMQMSLASFETPSDPSLDTKQEGIVVQFPISNILPNPVWKLRDSNMVGKLMGHLDEEAFDYYEVPYRTRDQITRIESYTLKPKDIFIVHINTDDETLPYKVYIDEHGALTLSRSSYTRAIRDKHGYFEFFSQFMDAKIKDMIAKQNTAQPQ